MNDSSTLTWGASSTCAAGPSTTSHSARRSTSIDKLVRKEDARGSPVASISTFALVLDTLLEQDTRCARHINHSMCAGLEGKKIFGKLSSPASTSNRAVSELRPLSSSLPHQLHPSHPHVQSCLSVPAAFKVSSCVSLQGSAMFRTPPLTRSASPQSLTARRNPLRFDQGDWWRSYLSVLVS